MLFAPDTAGSVARGSVVAGVAEALLHVPDHFRFDEIAMPPHVLLQRDGVIQSPKHVEHLVGLGQERAKALQVESFALSLK